ncbi:30S ribosomal protein S4 [Candidatus Woesearchaeota archaeon]|nr:30S ribosomal protein S4 [Candidatus Woesearchaeota archaeon]
MGDPRKLKKKYATPQHPWIRSTIEEEKVLKKDYGLVKKKEILIASSFLKKYKDIAKRLIADRTAQGEREKKQMMDKLHKYGLLKTGAGLDDVLSIQLKDVLERRIQSLLFRKGLARSMKQARQFIVHRHIVVGNREITSPGHLLTVEEENQLIFKGNSALASDNHPERVSIAKETAKEIKKEIEAINSGAQAESGMKAKKAENKEPKKSKKKEE